MSFLLQYQAHVEDLTSAAASPLDTSWFHQEPDYVPRRPTVPPQGEIVGDLTTGDVAVVDDGSAFIDTWDIAPRRPSVPPQGLSVGDIESAAAFPDDVSWLIERPDTPPRLRPAVPPQGESVGDFTSGEGVAPDDGSAFIDTPGLPPTAPLLPPQGFITGDINTDVGRIFAEFGVAFKNEQKSWTIGDNFTLLAVNDPVTISVGGDVDTTDRYTSDQTLTPSNENVVCDTDGGAFRVSLPAGVNGMHLKVSNVGTSGNALSIIPHGAELLVGENTTFDLLDGETLDLHYETTEGWIA